MPNEEIDPSSVLAELDTTNPREGVYSGETACNKAFGAYNVKSRRYKHGTIRQFIGRPYSKEGNMITDKSVTLEIPDNQTIKALADKILDRTIADDGKPNGKTVGPFIIKRDGFGFYTLEPAATKK